MLEDADSKEEAYKQEDEMSIKMITSLLENAKS